MAETDAELGPANDRAARFNRGHTQDTVGRNTAADATLKSRRAAIIYFSGSMPVIFFKPLALARSTAAFTTAKIAP